MGAVISHVSAPDPTAGAARRNPTRLVASTTGLAVVSLLIVAFNLCARLRVVIAVCSSVFVFVRTPECDRCDHRIADQRRCGGSTPVATRIDTMGRSRDMHTNDRHSVAARAYMGSTSHGVLYWHQIGLDQVTVAGTGSLPLWLISANRDHRHLSSAWHGLSRCQPLTPSTRAVDALNSPHTPHAML